jgi:hypothetical protein
MFWGAVVVTVTVALALLLIDTNAGDVTEQLASFISEGTAQVRLTVPMKPPSEVMTIVVFALCPLVRVRGERLCGSVKVGAGAPLTVTFTELL